MVTAFASVFLPRPGHHTVGVPVPAVPGHRPEIQGVPDREPTWRTIQTVTATCHTWPADELERIGSARELQIAVKRDDGTLRGCVPVWVVLVVEQVCVRIWFRRETG